MNVLTDEEIENIQNQPFSQNDWLWFYTREIEAIIQTKLACKLKDSERLEWLVKAQCVLINDFDGLVFPYWHTSGRRGEAKPAFREAIDAAMEGKTK